MTSYLKVVAPDHTFNSKQLFFLFQRDFTVTSFMLLVGLDLLFFILNLVSGQVDSQVEKLGQVPLVNPGGNTD
jgi:hypothetical protein